MTSMRGQGSPSATRSPTSARSPPAENARPAPERTTARTLGVRLDLVQDGLEIGDELRRRGR